MPRVGSQWFGGPVLSGSWVISTPRVRSSARGQHYTLRRGWSWPQAAGGRRPPEQESRPGDKSITQRFEEGKYSLDCRYQSHPWHKPRHPRAKQNEVHGAKAAPKRPCDGGTGRGAQGPGEGMAGVQQCQPRAPGEHLSTVQKDETASSGRPAAPTSALAVQAPQAEL